MNLLGIGFKDIPVVEECDIIWTKPRDADLQEEDGVSVVKEDHGKMLIQQVRKKVAGEGTRYIVVHAGGKNGFVKNASLLFSSGKCTGDYHGDLKKMIINVEVPPELLQAITSVPLNALQTTEAKATNVADTSRSSAT
ncbi:hypothetical protein CBL_02966 [Carabus blaptoides fortunei]